MSLPLFAILGAANTLPVSKVSEALTKIHDEALTSKHSHHIPNLIAPEAAK